MKIVRAKKIATIFLSVSILQILFINCGDNFHSNNFTYKSQSTPETTTSLDEEEKKNNNKEIEGEPTNLQAPAIKPSTSDVVNNSIVIKNIKIENLTSTKATFSWEVNSFANGQIYYGLIDSLENTSKGELSFDYKSHTQTIENLNPNSTYYYSIYAKNKKGEVYRSPIRTFKTLEEASNRVPLSAYIDRSGFGPQSPFSRQDDPRKNRQPLNMLESFENTIYGSTTKRISVDMPHHYSKRQAFNVNETLINLRGKIVSAETFQLVNNYQTGISSIERNWSNTDPYLVYGVGSNGKSFVTYDIKTQKTVKIIELNSYSDCTLGSGEGNISIDDRYVFLDCLKNGNKIGLSIDLQNKKILASLNLENDNYNWGSFSQSGKYIIIQGFGTRSRAYLYDKNLNRIRKVTDKLYHGDFGYNDKGEEVYAAISWDYVHYFRLSDNELVFTARDVGHGHLSCRNIKRPGWCYYSPDHGEIGAVKLSKGNGNQLIQGSPPQKGILGTNIVEHLGFHRSKLSDYSSYPKVTVSPSGRSVIFNSNWFGKHPTTAYMINFTGYCCK